MQTNKIKQAMRWFSVFFMSICVVVAGIIIPAPALASVQATLYASPTGSGSTCSQASPCSLTGARDKARTINGNMTGDIVVYLRGGTYQLSSPFQLTESTTTHDSGTNGYNIIYQAYTGETPVISGGGTPISGWSLYDSIKNIYRSNVGTSLQTRQLYVNDVRATRARGVSDPSGFTETTAGYTTTDTTMQNWGNVSDIEFVNFFEWKSFRCGISSVSGTNITMKQPCWDNLKSGRWSASSIKWIENAYELLDTEGEWYLNRSTGYLYYKPRSGENMSTATVIAPSLETLLNGSGTLDNPLHNLQFYGITFAHATWLRPNDSNGFIEEQANFTYVGSSFPTGSDPRRYDDTMTKTPANVTFYAAKSIRLERNVFKHLGGACIGFNLGSQNNTIIGNQIYDVSGSGVQIGGVSQLDHHPSDSRNIVLNNTVTDNYIHDVAVEYHAGVGVFYGYTNGTVVSHNEILQLPYTGVHGGWGWGYYDVGGRYGYATPTIAQNNKIEYNYIHNFMQTMRDGGGIYTLSKQGSSTSYSTIKYNHLDYDSNEFGTLYLDNGSQYFDVSNNVARHNYSWWIFAQNVVTPYAANNLIQNNYSDTSSSAIASGNTVSDNTVVTNGIWPTAAQTIMNSAGIEAAYQDIKNGGSTDTTYSFDDFSSETACNGVHNGIDFGTGQWMAGYNGYGFMKGAYFSADVGSRTFTIPSGKVLKSIKVSAGSSSSTYTISDGVNTNKTGTISSSNTPVTVTTGWTSTAQTITVTLSAHWGAAIDDIVYGDPGSTDTTYSFDDFSSETACNGVHNGIDFGTGQWMAGYNGYGFTKGAYFSEDVGSRTFTIPSGKVLKSIKVSAGSSSSTYTISDGVNTNKTGTISSANTPVTVTTGWTSTAQTITVTLSAHWGAAIDDIVY